MPTTFMVVVFVVGDVGGGGSLLLWRAAGAEAGWPEEAVEVRCT